METTSCKTALQTALFPCLGLGDGLIALILAHNFKRVGRDVVVFHPLLPQMAPLFPGIELKPRPDHLEDFGKIILFYEKLDWMQGILNEALKQHREKTTILNPIATPNRDYPYWEEGRFDGSKPLVDNLLTYLEQIEEIEGPICENGITLPPEVIKKRYPKRVVLHPTSSRAGKNWTKEKYLKLADRLEKKGYEPVFILTQKEAIDWPEAQAPTFDSLVEVTHFVAESGYMIGNDSGIGHLASCLGIPTLTICRSKMTADFWRPAFGKGEVIVPPRFIPNLKGMRWRDQKWQHFVPVSKVEKEFLNLSELGVLGN